MPIIRDLETVARGVWLEGLAVDIERGIVWYSDVMAGGVHGLLPDGRTKSFNRDRRWCGSILLNQDGCVLSPGPGGIMWNDPETGRSGWLLDAIDGQPISGINEMTPDGSGGIYFGTSDIERVSRGEAPRPTSIYRLTADRRLTQVADGFKATNGLTLNPEGTKLYFNETFVGTHVFDVQSDGTLANKRTFLDKFDVDGMALMADGEVWITGFGSSEISRLSPDGALLAPIPTPAAVSQLRFGGSDLRDIYITTLPDGVAEILATGKLPSGESSILYRGRSDVPGLRIPAVRFTLI